MSVQPGIDDLLDRAVTAINRGDRATSDALAGRVLSVDRSNLDAEELLAAPMERGEIRRLTMLFADLVDSTALSTRIEPEVYRTVVGRYRDEVQRIVAEYEGHIASAKGDGLLAVFGHPTAHENDAQRAVQAGLDITRAIKTLSRRVRRNFGFEIDVRVGIHRGLVYLDIAQDDVFGLGANLAARICSVAEPGTVAVSTPIQRVIQHEFELEEQPPKRVKGVDEPLVLYRAVVERETTGPTRGPLVGRHDELDYLRESWAKATTGTLQTPGVVFRGEGGIGKSRLAGAAEELAERAGAPVLGLFGSPFHTDVGLRPVRRMLERRCGIGPNSEPGERLRKLRHELELRSLDVDRAMPLLAPVLGIAPEQGYQPPTANAGRLYGQIATAVKEYLLACTHDGPGLILIEDIHWFDEDTLEIVDALLRDGRGRLLIVVTGREVPTLPEGTVMFDVKPLADTESDALITALHPELSSAARRAVQERCDGIPLYIEEVVAKLSMESGDSTDSTQVPDTLYEALVARLRTASNTLRVVEAAAIIGGHVDQRLLASVVDLGTDEVTAMLKELTNERVLRPAGEHSWRFRHELLREVAAELPPPSAQRRLHNRISGALIALATDGVPEWPKVAHHFERGENFGDAASAYLNAAADARRRGALNEARHHLSRALANIDRLPATRARDRREVAVRLQRGFLTSAAAGHVSAEAAAEFERCLQLTNNEPTPELYATFSALWSYYAARGDLTRATRLVDALRSRIDDIPDWYRAAIDAVAGTLAMFRGDFHTARGTLEAAAQLMDDLDSDEIEGSWFAPNDPIAGVHLLLGFVRFLQGDLPGSEAAFTRAERRCEKLGFPHGAFTLCYTRAIETLTRVEAGQFDVAAELTADIGARAEEHGFDEWAMIAKCNTASVGARMALASDHTDPAAWQLHIAASTAIVDGWRAAERKTFLACYDGVLARVLTAAGMKDEARDRADLALRMADETDMHYYDAELMRIRAHTHDDPELRCADLLAAIRIAHKQGALTFELRCAADYFEELPESAGPVLAEVVSHFPAEQSWPELDRARTLLG